MLCETIDMSQSINLHSIRHILEFMHLESGDGLMWNLCFFHSMKTPSLSTSHLCWQAPYQLPIIPTPQTCCPATSEPALDAAMCLPGFPLDCPVPAVFSSGSSVAAAFSEIFLDFLNSNFFWTILDLLTNPHAVSPSNLKVIKQKVTILDIYHLIWNYIWI